MRAEQGRMEYAYARHVIGCRLNHETLSVSNVVDDVASFIQWRAYHSTPGNAISPFIPGKPIGTRWCLDCSFRRGWGLTRMHMTHMLASS
jgi:hypothetical protein